MADERDNNNFSYYFKLIIKLIIFVMSVYYIYKYRATIRRYISIINRWLRFSSPLRNINARFRNFRERGLNEQREPLLDQIEQEFQDNLQPENFQGDDLQRGIAAAAGSGIYLRNNNSTQEIEDAPQRPLPRRSGRVANWTGPINERIYKERRAETLRANEVNLEQKRADREAVIAKTGGYTIPYLKNWLTGQGLAQPEIQNLQGYFDLVLGRTEPIRLAQPRQPTFVGESSSAPLQDINALDEMYLQRGPSPSSMMYQQIPPNYLDQQFKPVDFGRSNYNRNANNRSIRMRKNNRR
jgi:hypothetical protein